jgi:ABC-type transport system involved in multi-copper enzyme maturation permease subunit
MTAETLPASLCLAVLLGASLVSLALAAWIFSKREYVLEQ